MRAETQAITFDCAGSRLIGFLHRPETPKNLGVVIVAGAPQYRIGSHRHFLLLARDLAAEGFPVLRFDYRGMGDSDGEFRDFEKVDEDIRSALDAIGGLMPEIEGVALWGLCDGAAALAFYAPQDDRVRGTVMLNPWVRTDRTLAQQQISGHYRGKLTERDFWIRLFSGKVDLVGAAGGLISAVLKSSAGGGSSGALAPLPDRVATAIREFRGPSLLILSGQDGTAQEFDRAVLKSTAMSEWTSRAEVSIRRLEGANHTYSKESWRRQVHAWTREWLDRL